MRTDTRQRAKTCLAVVLIIFCILINPFHLSGKQAIKNRDTGKQKNKIDYKNYIWIEGENAVATNFSKEKTYNFFCSERYALQLSKDSDPASEKGYYATYVFYTSQTKKYDFWMGCSPPGSTEADRPGYASPFDWKIDEGEFRRASSENTYVKDFYAPGSYYWVKISSGELSVGRHTLTIRVNQKRSSGWDYYFYIDAICFIPSYSGYLIPLMRFPETAPVDFDVKGKGINFRSVDYYKKRLKKNINDRESMFALLQIYSWLYEYGKSIDLCKKYLKRNAKDIQIRILLASSLAWSDRLDEAIKEYKNIISIDKKNITARKLLAVLAGWNNRYEEAIKNYKEIIAIDPRNVDAYISLATQYSWKGDVNNALDIFKKAESIAPDNIEVLYTLGDNYHWSGKTYKAIKQFKKIISINEKEIEAYKKLARIYIDIGEKKSADNIINEAARIIRIYPEVSGFSLDIEGEMDRDRKATLEEYKKALAKNPENIETRKNLIDTYIWNKMDDEAIDEYNNLLNMKVVKKIDKADEKLTTLAIQTIKFQMIEPIIKDLKKQISGFTEQYSEADSLLEKGKGLPEELNDRKIKNDLSVIRGIIKKIDLLERNLSSFNDVISYYDKDVQSYISQKDALNWKINSRKVLQQAQLSKENTPGDFRPRKVIGVIEYLYGDLDEANNELSFVYQKKKMRAFPVYLLSLSHSSRYKEAGNVIKGILNNKQFKGRVNNNLKQLQEFITVLQTRQQQGDPPPGEKRPAMVKEINRTALVAGQRLSELSEERKDKLGFAQSTIRQVYEKAFLDMENDNVTIYKDIAGYYINKERLNMALDYYDRILQVQPLNVEVNYKLGNFNEVQGYWQSSMGNYEICINNQPDNQLARKGHYDLQKEYSPSLKNNFIFFQDYYDKEKISRRIDDDLTGMYPMNDWLTLTAGYGFRKIDDSGGVTKGEQVYYPAKGSAQRHSIFAGPNLNIVPLGIKLFFLFTGHNYTGKVDFEDVNYNLGDLNLDSNLSYTTLNYGADIELPQLLKGFQVRLGYAFEDEADQTQSLKLKFRDEITSVILKATIDLSFTNYNFPLSDRIFLYDSFIYRMLSDDNIRISSYNQLTFKILSFPSYGIDLDINSVLSLEKSDFTEYTSGEVTNLSYWAPEDIMSLSGGVSWKHAINDILNGELTYELNCQYGRGFYKDTSLHAGENFTQTSISPGIKITQKWDKLELFISYAYSTSTSAATTFNTDPKPYESHNGTFGITGKFFKVYSPEGLGTVPIVLATAYPNMITADGDGKDDFTSFTLTAFDEKGIVSWELEIFNKKGAKVKSFGRRGTPPATIKWDGTDKAHNLLPQAVYIYQLSIVNTANERSVSKKNMIFLSRMKRAITPEVSYPVFSPNGDRIKDTISIEFKSTDKEEIDNWILNIMDTKKRKEKKKKGEKKKKKKRVVRTIKGAEFIPYDIQWDGRDNKGNILPDGDYTMSLKVKYKDKSVIDSPEIKIRITTKVAIDIKANTNKFLPARDVLHIIPRSTGKDIESWKLALYSIDNRLIKVIHGSGKLPKDIPWKGTDEKGVVIGYNMPVIAVMELVDRAGNRGKSNKVTVWLDFMKKELKGKRVITLFDQGIIHDRKKAGYSKNVNQIIERLINEIKRMRNVKKIRVVAHTSSDGSAKKNLTLSRDRARQLGVRIRKELKLKKGIVTIRGMGETQTYIKQNSSKWDTRYEIELQ